MLLLSHDNIYLRSDLDKDVLDRNVVDPEAVVSQAQIVLSRDLAKEVIAKLKLNELPEFDPALSGVSLVKSLLGFFGIVKNPLAMTPEERVLEAYYDRLTVFPVEKSRVIVIDFLSENPELAAQVANAIADAYLERQQAAKQEQAKSAGVWLGGQIDELRKKVAEADNKVEAFRAKSNLLVGPNNTTLSTQQLGDLNAQIGRCARAKGRRRGEGETHPRHAQVRPADRFLRHPQFRTDPPAFRAAGDVAGAACRAIFLAPR